MNRWIAFLTFLVLSVLGGGVRGESEAEMQALFGRGLARLEARKGEIFNLETLPAFKSLREVKIAHALKRGAPADPQAAYVGVRLAITEDSGHIKEFWFTFKEGKWVLTRSARSPWERGRAPKVSVEEDLSQTIQRKVRACFEEP